MAQACWLLQAPRPSANCSGVSCDGALDLFKEIEGACIQVSIKHEEIETKRMRGEGERKTHGYGQQCGECEVGRGEGGRGHRGDAKKFFLIFKNERDACFKKIRRENNSLWSRNYSNPLNMQVDYSSINL